MLPHNGCFRYFLKNGGKNVIAAKFWSGPKLGRKLRKISGFLLSVYKKNLFISNNIKQKYQTWFGQICGKFFSVPGKTLPTWRSRGWWCSAPWPPYPAVHSRGSAPACPESTSDFTTSVNGSLCNYLFFCMPRYRSMSFSFYLLAFWWQNGLPKNRHWKKIRENKAQSLHELLHIEIVKSGTIRHALVMPLLQYMQDKDHCKKSIHVCTPQEFKFILFDHFKSLTIVHHGLTCEKNFKNKFI